MSCFSRPLRHFSLIAFAFWVPLAASSRTFTSPDGKKLEAELQSATDDSVTLKLPDGRVITTKISHFAAADVAYIAEWRKLNPVSINYQFEATLNKEKVSSSKSKQAGEEKTSETWLGSIKLRNLSRQPLEDLKITYDIYFTESDSMRTVQRKTEGSAQILGMRHLEETVLKTKPIPLVSRKLQPGFYYGNTTRSRFSDTLDGVVIRVHHGGKKVYVWASPGLPQSIRSAVEAEIPD